MFIGDRIKQTGTASADTDYALVATASGYKSFFDGLNMPAHGTIGGTIDYPNVPILVEAAGGAWQVITATVSRNGTGVVTITSGVVRASSTGSALGLTGSAAVTLSVVPTKHLHNAMWLNPITFASAADEYGEAPKGPAGVVAIGRGSTASMAGCVSVGSFARNGYSYGAALGGHYGGVNHAGEIGTAAGGAAYPGDATLTAYGGVGMGFLRQRTTNATPAKLAYYIDGGTAVSSSGDRYINSGVTMLRGMLTAIDVGNNDSKVWDVLLIVETSLDYSTTTMRTETFTEKYAAAGASAWTVDAAPDNGTNTLAINVTGEAAKNIVWELSYTAHNHGFDL